MSRAALPTGSTIGIIGGGQLGRMLAMAAARLGFRIVILDPDPGCPAAQTASEVIAAAYGDEAALRALAARCDVLTYEFENVPAEPLRRLGSSTRIYPPVEALEVAQDRVVEKAFLNGIGVATAPWRAVDDAQELDHALLELGGDCILKTRRFGYDGKGQTAVASGSSRIEVWGKLGGEPCILEQKVSFRLEFSVIAARGLDGRTISYDPAENVHRGGILASSTVPAALGPASAVAAAEIACRIADRLGYVGVLGVEFFLAADGALLVNEIAPRVHNSGHWTEAACAVSQFEQHIRAVAGLPLGAPLRHSDCVMENLIGDDVAHAFDHLSQAGTVLHLYGKSEARAGRKMGHFTRLLPLAGAAPRT